MSHEIAPPGTSNRESNETTAWPHTDISFSGNANSLFYEYLLIRKPADFVRPSGGTSPSLTLTAYISDHYKFLSFAFIALWVLVADSPYKKIISFIQNSDGMK